MGLAWGWLRPRPRSVGGKGWRDLCGAKPICMSPFSGRTAPRLAMARLEAVLLACWREAARWSPLAHKHRLILRSGSRLPDSPAMAAPTARILCRPLASLRWRGSTRHCPFKARAKPNAIPSVASSPAPSLIHPFS